MSDSELPPTRSRDPRGRPLALWALIGLSGTLGVRGLLGGGQFLLVPSGDLVGVSTRHLTGTPFGDYLVPGAVLFVALGVGPLVVTYGLYRGDGWAWFGVVLVGVVLAAWVIVEGVVVGFGERLQYPNLVQAVAMVLLAGAPSVREHLDRPVRTVRER